MMVHCVASQDIKNDVIREVLNLPIDGTKAVEIKDHEQEKRRDAQNRLYHRWNRNIADQVDGMDVFDVMAENKLMFGVPIRMTDCDTYRKMVGSMLSRYTHEQRLAIMRTDIIAVTRDMTVKQMTEFLTRIEHDWSNKGVKLTNSDDLYFQSMGLSR